MSLYLIERQLIACGLTAVQADEIISMVREWGLAVLARRMNL